MHRATRRAMALQHGPTIPMKGDPQLYTLDGVTALQISDATHETTLRRWREWRAKKGAGDELRARIRALKREVGERSGDLLQPWGHALQSVIRRHLDLDKAARTRLPMTRELFERASGLRGIIGTAAEYRQLLVGMEEPVRAIAEACGVERERIEALREERVPFVEFTFLHRQYRFLIEAGNPLGRVRMTLDCIYAFVDWTHGPFSKTTVSASGSSHSISLLSQSLETLAAFVDFIDHHTAHSTGDQQAAVTRVLACLEAIWGMPVPDRIDEYLQLRCRTLRECF